MNYHFVKEALEALEEAFPYPDKAVQNHSFMMNREGQLVICVRYQNQTWPFVFDEDEDYEKSIAEMLDEIKAFFIEHHTKNIEAMDAAVKELKAYKESKTWQA